MTFIFITFCETRLFWYTIHGWIWDPFNARHYTDNIKNKHIVFLYKHLLIINIYTYIFFEQSYPTAVPLGYSPTPQYWPHKIKTNQMRQVVLNFHQNPILTHYPRIKTNQFPKPISMLLKLVSRVSILYPYKSNF